MRTTIITTIILVLHAMFTASALAQPGARIRVPQDVSTIQAAIDASGVGSVIVVSKGTYYESLLIEQATSLTIRANKGKVVLDAAGDPTPITISDSTNVTIRGLTLMNGLSHSIAIRDSLWTNIEKCTLNGSPDCGIRAESSDFLRVSRCKIKRTAGTAVYTSDCDNVSLSKVKVTEAGSHGIVISTGSGTAYAAMISNCSITAGTDGFPSAHGISIDSRDAIITRNSVHGMFIGLYLRSDRGIARENKVVRGTYGMLLSGDGLDAIKNRASRTQNTALTIQGDGLFVSKNSVKKARFGAFDVEATNSTIDMNQVSRCGEAAYRVTGSGNALDSNTARHSRIGFDVYVSNNSFVGNTSTTAESWDLSDHSGGNTYTSNNFKKVSM